MRTDNYSRFLQRESLKVVVLGPGEGQPFDLEKRRQIVARLREQGYSLAMLGEELLGDPEEPLHVALRSVIGEIDLLLVLNSGVAALAELSAISFDLRARQITRVWSKREYDEGRRTTPSDIVKMFDNLPFNKDEFESCELVESVIATAERFCMSKAQHEGRLTSLGLPPPNDISR